MLCSQYHPSQVSPPVQCLSNRSDDFHVTSQHAMGGRIVVRTIARSDEQDKMV